MPVYRHRTKTSIFRSKPWQRQVVRRFSTIRLAAAVPNGLDLRALDLIYIDQTASPDSRLFPIFSKNKPLMEQDERGVIVYFSNSSIERTSVSAYFA